VAKTPAKRCGYVAILGRPNVGKSTLLNHIINQKISITSRKSQTTRHRILGINTKEDAQIIYVDTPGMHRDGKRAMNRYMNKQASATINDVDAIIYVVTALEFTEQDQFVLEKIKGSAVPVIAAVNKVDRVKDKESLLPYIQRLSGEMAFNQIIPISAKTGDNVHGLEDKVVSLLPVSGFMFSADQLTDKSERFLAAEIIREKLMRRLGDELPYALTVEISKFAEEKKIIHIDAIIWVERDGQKSIVIGKQGAMLKNIGKQARVEMEKLFENKVFLSLWVKVKEGWSDDERALISLGYHDG